MIIEKIFYAIQCDNCGVICADDEYSYWAEKWMAFDEANNYDWEEDEDKIYCYNCASFDDNDVLIIDESRKNLHTHQ